MIRMSATSCIRITLSIANAFVRIPDSHPDWAQSALTMSVRRLLDSVI